MQVHIPVTIFLPSRTRFPLDDTHFCSYYRVSSHVENITS
jgi:hypothetical protein